MRCDACALRVKNHQALFLALDGNLKARSNLGVESDTLSVFNSRIVLSAAETTRVVEDAFPAAKKKGISPCSADRDYTAAKQTGKKMRPVNGLVVIVCCHGCVLACSNILKTGERFAHAVGCLINGVIDHLGLTEAYEGRITLGYDVACMFKPYMRKQYERSKTSDAGGMSDEDKAGIQLLYEKVAHYVVGAFHSYMHNSRCRVMNSCRMQMGVSIDDYEGVERFWGWLKSGMGNMSEMAFASRMACLDARIRYFNHDKRNKQPSTLRSKWAHAKDAAHTSLHLLKGIWSKLDEAQAGGAQSKDWLESVEVEVSDWMEMVRAEKVCVYGYIIHLRECIVTRTLMHVIA